jgi:hypothetical protein
MSKGIIIKASIILGFFAVTLGLALGCSTITDKNEVPTLSNADDVYLTLDGEEITYQEVWDLMKIADGLTYLFQYVD